MSATLPPWPALSAATPTAGPLTWQRGIWGKVHGAASDYRWIARGSGFGAGYGDAELAAALRLGAEDRPVTGSLWRRLPEGHLACALYPSRARDSAGRLTVLEKQVADWRPGPDGLPAALAALALLPALASHDDRDWWDAGGDPRWALADFALGLPDGAVTLPDAAVLDGWIRAGCAALAALTEPPDLAACYQTLLSGRVPALLPTAASLPPLALAVLLLPLPPVWAAGVSLAGELAARTPDPWDLRRNWDLIASPVLRPAPVADDDPDLATLAAAIAEALRTGNPDGLGARYGALGISL